MEEISDDLSYGALEKFLDKKWWSFPLHHLCLFFCRRGDLPPHKPSDDDIFPDLADRPV